MKSRIYHCQVMHARLKPSSHHFVYPAYVYAIDLDELPDIDRTVPGFGYNRLRPVSIHDRDYLNDENGSIAAKLNRFLDQKSLSHDIHRIELVTSARYFNYVFNPVSFYYCYRQDGSLRCTVAEVNNTFREKHLYILDRPNNDRRESYSRFTVDKEFHVSPFNDMQGQYDFKFSELGDAMDIRLDILREGKATFKSRIWGNAVPLSSTNLMRTIVNFPITAWLTMPRILWQAAKLYYGKKMIVYTKPNPTHTMTIRTASASFREKIYSSLVMKYLSNIQQGCLHVTLPDRSSHLFGDAKSSLRADVRIHNYDFFRRVVRSGDIGFGESYTAGDWSANDLTSLLTLFIHNQDAMNRFVVSGAWLGRKLNRLRRALRKNTIHGSRDNIHAHYDLSNDFFRTFLDSTMTYSCAMFQNDSDTLEQAQRNKLDAIIRMADIQPTDHVLEIGSGWGSFAIRAVKQTGCRITTITLSEEQLQLARERIREAGMDDRIDVHLCDYRSMTGAYDKLISIEMIEAVGHEYLGAYFSTLDRLLKPGGLAVIQAITIIDQHYDLYRKEGDWIQKHIFPGASVPSLKAINDAISKYSQFFIDRVENIGIHYARTLREWKEAMLANRDRVLALGFDEKFLRTWEYYFSYCEAGFAARVLNNLQIVLTRSEKN